MMEKIFQIFFKTLAVSILWMQKVINRCTQGVVLEPFLFIPQDLLFMEKKKAQK